MVECYNLMWRTRCEKGMPEHRTQPEQEERIPQVVAAVLGVVFGIGVECCWTARVEGSWHTSKGEGVLGRTAVGGVRTAWYNFLSAA